jgi:hypothetical protein
LKMSKSWASAGMLAVWILRSEIHTKSATSQSFSKYPYHCMHSHCILDCLLT